MPNPRELRLMSEFEGLKALHTRYSLFNFYCADLTSKEATALLMGNLSPVELADFLPPEEFEKRYPGMPPEKYLIFYDCVGIEEAEDGTLKTVARHAMEVIFGWHYPAERPNFIWLTNIWHPNFKGRFICIEGRPFAVGLTLSQIVPEVGRMIQYQNYNVKDPLNRAAAEWTHLHEHLLPIDDRDILDSRRLVGRRLQDTQAGEEPLIQIISENAEPDTLIELVDSEPDK
jgi:hypothetical protein